MSRELWVLKGSGQVLVNVHREGHCLGYWCTIHRPMPGPWENWPMHFVGDMVMVRRCPHDIAHPAIEDVINFLAYPDHECDGCECGYEVYLKRQWGGEDGQTGTTRAAL